MSHIIQVIGAVNRCVFTWLYQCDSSASNTATQNLSFPP